MKTKLFSVAFLLFTFFVSHSQVRIDIDKTQDPISEYIYGQFIEHLGNCIYNGMWAEMLEDRKFYYPVVDDFNPWGISEDEFWNAGEYKYLKASPWQVIGPQNTVVMDSVNPYTGVHSVKVELIDKATESGIRQSGLSLLSDNIYTGRIILAGHKKADPVIVRLVYEDGTVLSNEINKITDDFTEYPLEYIAPLTSDNVSIEIISSGKGEFRIGTLSLMNNDNILGWRKDVLALLKELNAPVYRWPGGNFVSGYNWRDGIGDRDKRPPRKNPAWKGVEHNDVGIHEYMELMDLINSEPFIAVNTGLGTVEEVAEEVEYCNGSAESPMGRLRAANGREEPYGIKFWAVGNEMYGSWQLGNMPLEDYVKKHKRMAEAMWQSDPEIKLIGVGAVGEWSETMLKSCSDHMDLISEHIYSKEAPDINQHVNLLSNQIKHVANAHRKYRKNIKNLQAKDIRIAMDEWNYWYGDYIYGELGVRYHLKDALGVAAGLHEYFRNSDIFYMANYAQTVNVIGAIKTTATEAAFDATGLPLLLYRQHFGNIPLELDYKEGNLNIAAALNNERDSITIAVINSDQEERKLTLDFGSTIPQSQYQKWTIQHSDPEAYNEPGKPAVLFIQEANETLTGDSLEIPGYSIVMYKWAITNY